MNKMIYVGVAIVIVIIAGVLLLGSGGSSANTSTVNQSATSAATTAATSTATTAATTSISTTINVYNTTTTTVSTSFNSSSVPSGCTASKYYTCTGLAYSNSVITATIGEDTGQNWSSYGIAYAPQGTPISEGVPTGIPFYTANATSTSNVGTSLLSGSTAAFTIPVSNGGSSVLGTLWVCYVNSGILYVGNGCTSSGGVPATYVEIGTVNT